MWPHLTCWRNFRTQCNALLSYPLLVKQRNYILKPSVSPSSTDHCHHTKEHWLSPYWWTCSWLYKTSLIGCWPSFHVLHKDETAWCYTYDFGFIYCDDWKKYLVCHLGRAFVCLSAFFFFTTRSLTADCMFHCSTVAQSLSIYFLQ